MTAARVFTDDGEPCGSVDQVGAGWKALDPDGRRLGSFETEQVAVHAVLRGHAHETARRDARSEELLALALDDMAGRWRQEEQGQAALVTEEASR